MTNPKITTALQEIERETIRQTMASPLVNINGYLIRDAERLNEALFTDYKQQTRIYATELAALIVRLMAERL